VSLRASNNATRTYQDCGGTCCAQSGTGILSQPTLLGEANQFFHKNAGPYAPGQNLIPLGNLRTVDFGGPYNNGAYNLSLLNVQEAEIQGAALP